MHPFAWHDLPRPFLALAPLHDVTDAAFRATVAACGKPDVCFTEFVSVEGLTHPQSRARLIRRYLQRTESERPVIAQLWGTNPDQFRDCAALAVGLGFDGIDINMGCPDKAVIKAGAGAALITAPDRAREIIHATREGAGAVPVSVKTRLGYETDVLETWLPTLLDAGVAAVTIHARTMRERSRVPARWDRVRVAAEMSHERGVICIGNGDLPTRAAALEACREYACDGAMLGRAIFGNFWLFDTEKSTATVPLEERLNTLVALADRFEAYYAGMRHIATLKKHIHGLVQQFPGAREMRAALMEARTADELRIRVAEQLARHTPLPTKS